MGTSSQEDWDAETKCSAEGLRTEIMQVSYLPGSIELITGTGMHEARRGSSRLVLGDRETERVVGFVESDHARSGR